jgi:hypothetical protein
MEYRGNVYYRYPYGSSILSIPFVYLMNLLGVSTIDSNAIYDLRGEAAIQRATAAVTMGALASVSFLTYRRFLPLWGSVAVTLALALGSQVWSTASLGLWSHTWGILLLGVGLFILVRGEHGGGRLSILLLGTVLAWTYVVRPTFLISIAAVVVYCLLARRRALPLLLASLVLWLGLFAALSFRTFGTLIPPHYAMQGAGLGQQGIAGFGIGVAGLLVSPSRGQLVFSPWIVLVGFMLVKYRSAIRDRWLVLVSVGALILHVCVVATWPAWWGGYSYGPRLLTDIVPWLALLGAIALRARIDARDRGGRRGSWPMGSMELAVGIALVATSIWVNGRGAWEPETMRWNVHPRDANVETARLWDWRNPQFMAGLTEESSR